MSLVELSIAAKTGYSLCVGTLNTAVQVLLCCVCTMLESKNESFSETSGDGKLMFPSARIIVCVIVFSPSF